jgi:thioredoxin-related protein
MKPALLGLTAILLLTGPSDPATAGPAPRVAWRSWDRGVEEARGSGRPMVVDVYTDWCGWCRRMEAEVYSRPDVRDYLSRKFVAVKLNAEAADPARYEGRAFTSRSLAARFGVSGYPTTIFLRADGDRPVNVPGYVDAERFLLLLRYVGDGHLDSGVSFQDFVKRSATSGVPRR